MRTVYKKTNLKSELGKYAPSYAFHIYRYMYVGLQSPKCQFEILPINLPMRSELLE